MYAIMMDSVLVWWMKLNKLSLSTRAEKQRDKEMASSRGPWELVIASEVAGQTFSKAQHYYYYYEKNHGT